MTLITQNNGSLIQFIILLHIFMFIYNIISLYFELKIIKENNNLSNIWD